MSTTCSVILLRQRDPCTVESSSDSSVPMDLEHGHCGCRIESTLRHVPHNQMANMITPSKALIAGAFYGTGSAK